MNSSSSLAITAPSLLTTLGFAEIQHLVADDMAAVNILIRERLSSDVVLINQIAEHIIDSGGKRLRPLLVLLAAQAAGYCGRQHIPLAAIVEFIHTATLLHDDVVDESNLRRGHKTANAVWGNAASVLVGDFLYSRSFQMMVEINQMRVMQILADTTNTIAEGEVLQLLHLHNADTDETAYLNVIKRKTAVLFSAATRLGAVLAGLTEAEEEALACYGLNLGYAFQIADDVLDYVGDDRALGKNIGDDLAEGKPTLPLIYAIERSLPEQASSLRRALETGGLDSLNNIVSALRDSGALELSYECAKNYAKAAKNALSTLQNSKAHASLLALADYAVDRSQ